MDIYATKRNKTGGARLGTCDTGIAKVYAPQTPGEHLARRPRLPALALRLPCSRPHARPPHSGCATFDRVAADAALAVRIGRVQFSYGR